MPNDFCAGCAIECLCDTSKYEAMSDAQLDAIAALDVNLADDASIDRALGLDGGDPDGTA